MTRPLILLALAALLGGCAPRNGEAVFDIPPGGYDEAFAAAKRALHRHQFTLERVDALAGVITTEPRPSSGLATPWDVQQSTLGQEFEDLLNQQRRTVRITFEPVGEPPPHDTGLAQVTPPPPPTDLRAFGGPIRARVRVVLERRHRPGRRIETTAIGLSTVTADPVLGRRRMFPSYWVPVAEDPHLAARLVRSISRRVEPAPADDG